jgi:hypothetical protein
MQDWGAMQARELTDHLEDILETDEVDIIPGQCRVEVQLCLYTYLCVKFIYVLVCDIRVHISACEADTIPVLRGGVAIF